MDNLLKYAPFPFALILLIGCTSHSRFTYHTRASFIYQDTEYEHPADVIYQVHSTYNNYTDFNEYKAMRITDREAVDHFLRSIRTCYATLSNKTSRATDKDLSADVYSEKHCDTAMGMYRELYRQGYNWRATGPTGRDPVFEKLLTYSTACKRYSTPSVKLPEYDDPIYFCSGNSSSNGGGSVNYWHGGSTPFEPFSSREHFLAL